MTTAPDVAAAPAEAPVENEPAGTCRALVLDDNQDAADTLKLLMQMLGHESRSLYDPFEVETAVAAFDPDIVFLDIGMPQMDGYEVARRIRRLPQFDQAVLVALTGWGQERDRLQSEAAGFDQHIVKPADMKALQSLLATAGEKVRQERGALSSAR